MNNNFSKSVKEINELHNIFHAISDIVKQRNGYFFFFYEHLTLSAICRFDYHDWLKKAIDD